MPRVAHVPTFGGGWIKEGAADQARSDEVSLADGYDIGSRGALVATRYVADYITINDLATSPVPWTRLHVLRAVAGANFAKELAVGEGLSVATSRYLMGAFNRNSVVSPLGGPNDVILFGAPNGGSVPAPLATGVLVTVAQFPGTYALYSGAAVIYANVFLVNIGAREGTLVNTAPGLYVVYASPTSSDLVPFAINYYGALGTGDRFVDSDGNHLVGTNASQLYFRGIAAYNGFAFGWGFNSKDTNKEGPARLMFSNLANPLKWGNDDQGAVAANRLFTDSDAIDVGDAGEAIRAALSWRKRLWIGTDQKMHFLAGYGRNSFITDGANPVAKAENVIGPHAMIEGPDGLLYGVGDSGLWRFDEAHFERVHGKLRDFSRGSSDAWDLIYNDRDLSDTYPGKTNADLVWMSVDWDTEQVLVGIPWCNASAGAGFGYDTVVIKYHPHTGGFTRQVFTNRQYTAADYPRRQRQWNSTRFFGTATAGQVTIQKYGEQDATSGQLPTPLPHASIGPYALMGPDGVVVTRRIYLTVAWEPGGAPGSLSVFTARTGGDNDQWNSVCWSPTLNLYCAVAQAGTGNRVMTSPDGITWTRRTTPVDNNWQSICWADTLGLFVAVANTGTGDRIMTSPNGTVWTTRVNPEDNQWASVCWSHELGLLVAVSIDGTNRVMTSPNGTTWTARSAAGGILNSWSGICWAKALGLFVAVANSGPNRVQYSSDGLVWNSASAAAANDWRAICWSEELGLLVATAITGSGNRVMTSTNGTSWASQTTVVDNQWVAVTWAAEILMFVAVSNTGTVNRAMMSTDGFSWAVATTTDIAFHGVAWSPSLLRIAAVGASLGDSKSVSTANGTASLSVNPSLQFAITPIVDDAELATQKLTIGTTAPGSPADGDTWVDTSQTDTNLGNGTAGAIIPALGGYLVKRWHYDQWEWAGVGGQKGQRVTVPVASIPVRGTRLDYDIDCLVADRRYQLEGLGLAPGRVTEAG